MRTSLCLIAILCAGFAFPLRAPAGDDTIARDSLKGLKGVMVGIDPPSLEAMKAGLTEELLKRGLEQKIRGFGIKVLDKQDPKMPAFLWVDITLNRAKDAPVYVYTITVSLKQLAILARDARMQIAVPTWALTRNGVAGEKVLSTAVHKATLELGDKFCAAFKAANPK